MRRPSNSKTSPPPSLTLRSQRTFSGWFAHTHRAPWSEPSSSSAKKTSSRSPDSGRQPRSQRVSAAAPHTAVPELTGPRVDAPLGGPGKHGVDVARERQHGPVRAAPEPRHEARPAVDGGQQLALEARAREELPQVLLERALVAWRVHRVEANEALEQLGGATL